MALGVPLTKLAKATRAPIPIPLTFLPAADAAGKKGTSLTCLALRKGRELIGFLPLFQRRDPKALWGRRVSPPLFGTSPAFELLIATGADREDVIDALAESTQRMPWIEQRFVSEPAGSTLATDWLARFPETAFAITNRATEGHYVVRGFSD